MGKINKVGTERVIAKKTNRGDIDIGNKIIAENPDLEGLDESSKNDKKEDVVQQPGKIQKHKMINELSNMKRTTGSSTRSIKSDSPYQRKSYLNKRGGRLHGTGRPKVNILALVDDAIEDGATDEAKQKASAGRAALTAPIPAQKKLVYVKRSIAEEKNHLQSRGTHSTKQKSTEKLSHSQNVEESTSSGSSSSNSVTPAWKARLEKQGEKFPEAENFRIRKPAEAPKSELKPRQVRIKKQKKKMLESSSYENNSSRNYKSEASPTSAVPSSLSIPPNNDAPVVDTERKDIPELIGSIKEKKRKDPIELKSKMNSVGPTTEITLPTIVKPKNERCVDNESREKCNNEVTSIPDTDRNDHPNTIEPSGSTEEIYPLDSKAKPIVVDTSSKFATQPFAKPNIGNGGGDKKSDKYEDANGLVYDSFEELTYKDSARQCGKKLVTTRLNVSEEERSENAKDEHDTVPEKINILSLSEGKGSTKPSRISRGDIVLDRLRQELEETKKRLDNVAVDHEKNLLELEYEFATRKKTVSFPLLKKIQHQEQKNKKLNKEYHNLIVKKKLEIDELRLGNQRLRIPLEKLPKQMAQMIASNNSLEKSNEEIAGHLDDLRKFSEKLQSDQDQLVQSSDKCKNEYLPSYRQELWERQEFLDAEIKIKNLYRDCNIRLTKKIERSKQIELIESVTTMVLETEGEVNPKFDPKFLSNNDSDLDSSTSSDSDDSDSDDSDSDGSDTD
mmetsp:Transcript_51668/g.58551  ORF Transcript_51668/g.58551 Transcript_51668/m.58551 type:complete len:731 (-) Transcript_51668:174-2366(-)|eukprot:CAMPEP_0170762480 /NCGR_PEP_ID=MMETSP0733-20121128/2781_1 /TAXON_ID=186038 /ORGANISM="Fragilariopsis kerguelensis, Strain L26-C5" /LENGTH=730 /DNA_ID=CAMNT_0011102641 /DNA_START=197 /DNA_END=2389 /DNA_ORIENTATION=-